ncbi:MAG: YiaA/YiaB family inner membrane protein [Polyangiaceae bacterium]
MAPQEPPHSAAWMAQVWISFVAALATMSVGIVYLPVDAWTRAFLGMGLLFSIGSTFSLAKSIRDDHEAKRLLTRIDEAKAARILRDFEKEAA